MAKSEISPESIAAKSEIDVIQRRESCRACLYTGVGTCVAISGYFLSLSLEAEEHQMGTRDIHKGNKQDGREINQNKLSTNRSSKFTQLVSAKNASSNLRKAQSQQLLKSSIKHSNPQIQSLLNIVHGKLPPNKNRPFLLAFSAAWAVAGAYRLYLN